MRLVVSLEPLGGAVHEAADVAHVLLLQLVHLLVLLVKLLQLEGARALVARVVEVAHGEFVVSRSRFRPGVPVFFWRESVPV